ncbi:hypothetical protein ACFYTQ_08865 [Nocardia sp. NPDC004068]|uniref:hypothetical protein n=1 Tax=Nocardia sp. NPDC004068 TaxID=3364303 RepID=UPI00369F7910
MAARSVPRPPFATDLLADLHADNLPPDLAEQLWPAVREDPDAQSFLRDLDEVSCGLRMLADEPRILHPMPAHVGARLDRLLDDLSGDDGRCESAPPTRPMPVADSDPTDEPVSLDRYRSRRLRWLTAAAAAVAVIAGSVVAVTALRGGDEAPPKALPDKPTPTLGIADDPSTGTMLSAMGRNDVTGPLAAPGALTGCAAAILPGRQVLGSMDVIFANRPAVLILLTGSRPPQITALVVGTDCTANDPRPLHQQDIG